MTLFAEHIERPMQFGTWGRLPDQRLQHSDQGRTAKLDREGDGFAEVRLSAGRHTDRALLLGQETEAAATCGDHQQHESAGCRWPGGDGPGAGALHGRAEPAVTSTTKQDDLDGLSEASLTPCKTGGRSLL